MPIIVRMLPVPSQREITEMKTFKLCTKRLNVSTREVAFKYYNNNYKFFLATPTTLQVYK